jgi:hypothetical protein
MYYHAGEFPDPGTYARLAEPLVTSRAPAPGMSRSLLNAGERRLG